MCGLGAGDVITGINDRKVTKAADLAIALDSFQVGDKVTLKVRRGDEGAQVIEESACLLACCLLDWAANKWTHQLAVAFSC